MRPIEFEDILEISPAIPLHRHYWLVRTNGGDYFDAFVGGNFIAIGHNEISLEDLKQACVIPLKATSIIAEKLKSIDPDVNRSSYAASQLVKFYREIKAGDIVLIPSHNSYHIYFGEVLNTETYEEGNIHDEYTNCSFIKRKKVKWLKAVYREKLDPYLYKLLYSHHTITEADSYASFIDKTLNSFFIKYDTAHLILEVESTNPIVARDLFKMGNALLDLVELFGQQNGYELNVNDIEIKVQLQSPGKIELSSRAKASLIAAGIFVIGAFGGGLKIHYGDFDLDLSTDGAVKKIIDWKNQEHDAKIKDAILQEHIQKFNIQKPEDVVKVLKQLSDNKERGSDNTQTKAE